MKSHSVPPDETPEPADSPERRWVPMVIAAAIVLALAVVFTLVFGRSKNVATVTPISAAPAPYASSLVISQLRMSETSNMAGNHLVYVDGLITNRGNRTVNGITVQVLFHSFANQVAQNVTQEMMFIRTREPYVDIEPVSAAPLKPGGSHAFRLIFDGVTQKWNESYPEIRIIHVKSK